MNSHCEFHNYESECPSSNWTPVAILNFRSSKRAFTLDEWLLQIRTPVGTWLIETFDERPGWILSQVPTHDSNATVGNAHSNLLYYRLCSESLRELPNGYPSIARSANLRIHICSPATEPPEEDRQKRTDWAFK